MNNKRTSSHFTDSLFERTAKWGNYKVPRAFPEKLWGHLHTRPPLASPHPNVLAVAWDSCCSDTLILNGCFFLSMACHGRHTLDDVHAYIIFILANSSSSSAERQISQILNLFQPIQLSPTFPNKTCLFGVNFPWFCSSPMSSLNPSEEKPLMRFTRIQVKWQHQLHLCQSRPADTCLMIITYIFIYECIHICTYFCTSMNKDTYVYKYVYVYLKTSMLMMKRKYGTFFSVVSSQCSFFQKHCWLQKINHSHDIDSPSSLSPILSIPEATCGGFSLSAMLSYLLPVFVNWRLANGTK